MLKLKLVNGPREGRQLRVNDTKPVSIGRRQGRLRLHDSRVSKHHAEIWFDDGAWLIRDKGSSNGTFLNQERVDDEVELVTGDLIQMGRILVKVLRADEIGMDAAPWSDDESGLEADESPGVLATADEPDLGHELLSSPDDSGESDSSSEMSPSQATDDEQIEDVDTAVAAWMSNHPEAVDTDGGIGSEIDEALAEESDADLISLEEPAPSPQRPGTTAITAISDIQEETTDEASAEPEPMSEIDIEPEIEAQSNEANEVDEDVFSSSNEASSVDLTPEISEASLADEDDADDDAPELVGLSLGQQAPQQPELQEDSGAFDIEDLVEEEPESEALDASDEQVDPVIADAVEEVVAPEANTAEVAGGIEDDSDEDADGFDLDADFEWGSELEGLVEAEEPPVATDFENEDALVADADSYVEVDESPELASLATPEASVEDEAADDLVPEDQPNAEVQTPPVSDVDTSSTESSPIPETEAESKPATTTGFDIDAAFDALSEGLDDELPSTDSAASGAKPASDDQPNPPSAQGNSKSDLSESQLDVDFIKDALARLGRADDAGKHNADSQS